MNKYELCDQAEADAKACRDELLEVLEKYSATMTIFGNNVEISVRKTHGSLVCYRTEELY